MIDADIFGIAFSVMVPLFTNVLLSICLLQLSIALPFLLTSLIVLQGWWRGKRKMDQLNLQVKRLYPTFGSGSNHKPYAFFMQHSKTYNKGRRVGLLRSAETRYASSFYAMHRALRCHEALESTVHSAQWKDLKRL
ncbi:hypothetical protein ACHAW5_000941 [Stephanodiscus triporus]|uniref:ABC transmembrane type-1 domain-containing protein n=1 Tax=Stephanodiscus triporus TaxID=2934178 RepID=A0ABD3P0Q5_9STRA